MNTQVFKYSFIFLIVLVLFPLFYPLMPMGGLDPSWQYTVSTALEKGMVFGKDIVFTFGPYASLVTGHYTPLFDTLIFTASIYLAICYGVTLCYLYKDEAYCGWIFLIALFITSLIFKEAGFFCYPLLSALLVFKVVEQDQKNDAVKNGEWLRLVLLIISFSPLGLLIFMKGSYLINVIVSLMFSVILLIANRKFIYSVTIIITILISALAFWVMAGYLVSDLPFYFYNMFSIISGYTEAMSLSSNGKKIIMVILYVMGACLAIVALAKEKSLNLLGKLFILALFSVYLFNGFKSGYVRHDAHALIASGVLLLGAFLLISIVRNKLGYIVILIAVLNFGLTSEKYLKSIGQVYVDRTRAMILGMTHGVKIRIHNNNEFLEMYDRSVEKIKNEAKIEKLEGTVDIYPFDQSYLIASGNAWNPRPVFQSYSAYTTTLLEINEAHLRGENAPDNIIFRIETIDKRYPTLDDGLSWPTILYNYKPIQLKNGFLYLKKKNEINVKPELKLVEEIYSQLGQKIKVPESNHVLYLKMDIHSTLLGKMANILFKTKKLKMAVTFEDGSKQYFRIISGIARSGFVISPFVETPDDFNKLFDANALIKMKRPVSIELQGNRLTQLFWKKEVKIIYLELPHE